MVVLIIFNIQLTKDELAYLLESIRRNTYAVDIYHYDQVKRKSVHESLESKFHKEAPSDCYNPTYFD